MKFELGHNYLRSLAQTNRAGLAQYSAVADLRFARTWHHLWHDLKFSATLDRCGLFEQH